MHARMQRLLACWWHSTVVEVYADAHHCHVEEKMQCSTCSARWSSAVMLACLLSLERRTDSAIEVTGLRMNIGAAAASKQVACYRTARRMYRAQRIW